MTPKYKRAFLGKVITAEVYAEIKKVEKDDPEMGKLLREQARYEQKHLKAYLRGVTSFRNGWSVSPAGFRVPVIEKVKFTLTARG